MALPPPNGAWKSAGVRLGPAKAPAAYENQAMWHGKKHTSMSEPSSEGGPSPASSSELKLTSGSSRCSRRNRFRTRFSAASSSAALRNVKESSKLSFGASRFPPDSVGEEPPRFKSPKSDAGGVADLCSNPARIASRRSLSQEKGVYPSRREQRGQKLAAVGGWSWTERARCSLPAGVASTLR